jgi:hypothetical protein
MCTKWYQLVIAALFVVNWTVGEVESEPRLVCHFSVYKSLQVDQVNASLCTHLIVDLISFQDAKLTAISDAPQMVKSLKAKNPSMKIVAAADGLILQKLNILIDIHKKHFYFKIQGVRPL